MKNSIAIAAGLVVVAFFFGRDLFPAFAKDPAPVKERDNSSLITLSPEFNFPVLTKDPVADGAWKTFVQYREYARLGNLEGIKSLSHQTSEECLDPERSAECADLMQTAFFFTEFIQEDMLNNYAYDEKQIVLSTDVIRLPEIEDPLMFVLFFTRTEEGQARVLGLKFCFGKEDSKEEECVNTNPETRDKDQNGWWNDVEARFN